MKGKAPGAGGSFTRADGCKLDPLPHIGDVRDDLPQQAERALETLDIEHDPRQACRNETVGDVQLTELHLREGGCEASVEGAWIQPRE